MISSWARYSFVRKHSAVGSQWEDGIDTQGRGPGWNRGGGAGRTPSSRWELCLGKAELTLQGGIFVSCGLSAGHTWHAHCCPTVSSKHRQHPVWVPAQWFPTLPPRALGRLTAHLSTLGSVHPQRRCIPTFCFYNDQGQKGQESLSV